MASLGWKGLKVLKRYSLEIKPVTAQITHIIKLLQEQITIPVRNTE
jgi:hypothetical protein